MHRRHYELVLLHRFFPLGAPIGNEKQPVRGDGKQPGTKYIGILSFFFSFLDNRNESRLTDPTPIYPFLLLYLSSYQFVCASLVVGVLQTHPFEGDSRAARAHMSFEG